MSTRENLTINDHFFYTHTQQEKKNTKGLYYIYTQQINIIYIYIYNKIFHHHHNHHYLLYYLIYSLYLFLCLVAAVFCVMWGYDILYLYATNMRYKDITIYDI